MGKVWILQSDEDTQEVPLRRLTIARGVGEYPGKARRNWMIADLRKLSLSRIAAAAWSSHGSGSWTLQRPQLKPSH